MRRLLIILLFTSVLPALLSASGLGSEEFESILDVKTGSQLRCAYNVQLLRDGIEAFPEREAMIRNASEYLLIQTFIFRRNPVSEEFLRTISERAEEEIEVKCIYGLFGSAIFSPFFLCGLNDLPVDFRWHLAALGEQKGINRIWHEKIMVADGNSAIISGMHFDVINLDREFLWFDLAAQRDLDILVEGPVVKDIQASFIENWELVGGQALDFVVDPDPQSIDCEEEGVLMRFITQKPMLHEDYRINNLYVAAIDAAERSIFLETPHLSPAREIVDALAAASRRGVEIKVVLNSFRTMDQFYLYPFTRVYIPILLREGIEIYEMRTRMTHAKLAVFDEVYSIVGSYNLSIRSAYYDTESVVAFYCPRLSRELVKWFEEGLDEAKKVRSLFW